MIAQTQVDAVRWLLQQGRLSQRQIAKQLDISRGVVSGIALGTRPDYSQREDQRALADEWFDDRGPVARCPECGGRVHMPCRLCHIRALNQQESQVRREARHNACRIALRQFLVALLRRQNLTQRSVEERKVG